MENASKALIIAGAILLAILLISLGIMIFNQAQDTVGNSGMSKAEITSFNSQFSKYEGTKKRGSEVKSLINEVRASNASDATDGNGRAIALILTNAGSDNKTDVRDDQKGIVTAANVTTGNIKSTATYTVQITGNDSSGYIKQITITKD